MQTQVLRISHICLFVDCFGVATDAKTLNLDDLPEGARIVAAISTKTGIQIERITDD